MSRLTCDLEELSEIIIRVARREEMALRGLSRGILFMPELAFVHAVGRALKSNAVKVFGTPKVQWLTEKELGDAGRTDLVFKAQERSMAIEFKMGGRDYSYVRDIEKLAALDPQEYTRLFCALVDAWARKPVHSDARIKAVDEHQNVARLAPLDLFTTHCPRYKDQICCVVGLWRIDEDFRLADA